MSHLPDESAFAAARHALALLHHEADIARKELAALRHDLAEARLEFGGTRAACLLEANEQLVAAALQAREISDSALAELDALSRASQFDALTETPGRTLILDRIANAIAQARRRGTRVGLLFLDVDGFKAINDAHGHAAGDDALRQVAARLMASVRESDTVGRYGGDEFLVLLPEVAGELEVAKVADKILVGLAHADAQAGSSGALSASIGIALYPDDSDDVAALIARADACMYRSKRRGGASFTFHSGRVVEATAGATRRCPVPAPEEQGEASAGTAGQPRRFEEVARARAMNARQLEFMALTAY
jgi:diguanylate cyclase (GGDEF)-like protein